ncbi:MAG: GNAT family N-acetyltransferase [Ilumatobacteraceae bacterium]
MHEAVRPLIPADIADVSALEAGARQTLRDQRGGPQRLDEVPPADWEGALGRAWVGTIDDVVVGYLEAELRPPVVEVRQVYVHPEARELGLGDDLLATAMAAGRAAGCTVLEGTALPGDRDTKNLFERAGVVARKIVVSKPL